MPKNVRVFHSTKQSKARLNPCSLNNGGCEHFCLLSHLENTHDSSGNRFRCKCNIGYELKRDLRTCKRITDSLIFSQVNSIRGISLNRNMITETRMPIIVPKIGAARAIEVDCKNNITFYYDNVKKAILQSKLSDESRDSYETTVLCNIYDYLKTFGIISYNPAIFAFIVLKLFNPDHINFEFSGYILSSTMFS